MSTPTAFGCALLLIFVTEDSQGNVISAFLVLLEKSILKRFLYFLSFLVVSLHSCGKKTAPYVVNESADYKKGESLIFKQNDSAFYYFNRVTSGSKDSLLVAMAYNQMAAIQSDAGDYTGSQESLTRSLKLLDEQNPRHRYCLASDYNELGITSFNLKHYDAALRYYDKAIALSSDQEFLLVIRNNKALIYQKKGLYDEALKLYDSIISQYNKNPVSYARILSNRARTRWLRDRRYAAAPELLQALAIRKREKNQWGENTSYAHLADYYAGSRPDSALFYARKMYALSTTLGVADDRLEALEKLIRLSSPAEVKRFFSIYQQLSDSLQTARNAARNQYALIRFEAEKHRAENLELQKENAEKQYQLVAAGIVLVGGSVFFGFWYRKRKQRLKLEAENAIQENQLRISKKVHDVVANGLYRIMSEIENDHVIGKEHLLDRMEEIYEQSRDLSYDGTEFREKDFQQTVSAMLTSFATANTRVLISGNTPSLWHGLSPNITSEVGHVLQELMVNMKKHSDAGNVVVRFVREDQRIVIRYTDDGKGFPADWQSGNGLLNTGNRIQSIGGNITFDSSTAKGARIRISFPVA